MWPIHCIDKLSSMLAYCVCSRHESFLGKRLDVLELGMALLALLNALFLVQVHANTDRI